MTISITGAIFRKSKGQSAAEVILVVLLIGTVSAATVRNLMTAGEAERRLTKEYERLENAERTLHIRMSGIHEKE